MQPPNRKKKRISAKKFWAAPRGFDRLASTSWLRQAQPPRHRATAPRGFDRLASTSSATAPPRHRAAWLRQAQPTLRLRAFSC
ncbi:hypothetical protein [Candidatus Viridilinea mediisalina]|uniref:hypothetical protein n=1 Tax=Candidatus Viridilinea mediisalina TaxID=2024553 RepID=UPI000F5A2DD8|nr:hypothetical protein [Candidatus Viridilinea mediisalina]